MFSNNFKWTFFAILMILFGLLAKYDPMNRRGTYDIDNAMVATIITRKPAAINELPKGVKYIAADGSVLSREARKIGGFHTGTVSISNGIVIASGDTVVGAEFGIDFNSIVVSDIPVDDEQNADLVLELEDFFNITIHPTGSFFLTSYDDGIAQGDLTLNGVTKSIEFPATIIVDEQIITIAADFYIQRSQWDLIKWRGIVQEELKIAFDLTTTIANTIITNTIIDSDGTTDKLVTDADTATDKTGSSEEDIINAMMN